MTITFRTRPGDKIIELGGGDCPRFRPNVDCRMMYDSEGKPVVDFTADFDEPLPISSDEWDCCFSHFCLEHISYTKVPQFISEILRILKPGGRCCIVTADTEAQLKWVLANPNGWDGKDYFTSASEILFGSQDYHANAHRVFFSHKILLSLFEKAGFTEIFTQSYGARDTDVCVTATKPKASDRPYVGEAAGVDVRKEAVKQMTESVIEVPVEKIPVEVAKGVLKASRASLYSKHYFHGGANGGYDVYRDFPNNWHTYQQILNRKPESVLDLGCARGYVIKRLQDVGVRACGMDISRHAWLTRVCDGVIQFDICETPWPWKNQEFDLCFSKELFELIPQEHIPAIVSEMERVSKRGLHGITLAKVPDKPKEWWTAQFPKGHEVVPKEDLEQGGFPAEIVHGDGKVKLSIGSYITMFHHGWLNMDLHDLEQFAAGNGYKYQKHDVRNSLGQFPTGSVDLIQHNHMLEHLTYEEGQQFLFECRRVLKPDTGAMRVVVPNAHVLCRYYADGEYFIAGEEFDRLNEINDGVENAPTPLTKLWAVLMEGHKAMYDQETLTYMLEKAGFVAIPSIFRQESSHPGRMQIRKETYDQQPEISLMCDAIPRVG